MIESVILVGAGQASAVAARTLRRRGFDGRLTLVGDESVPPYQRPPLSKEYLAGEQHRDELFLLTEEWCADNSVELRLGAGVRSLRAVEREIELADGALLRGDAVLLATGGRPRTLPGVEGERVRYLRTLAESERLRAELRPGVHVIVVGAGFIGSEVASTAREAGARVTVIERAPRPLDHALGAEMGDVCAALHRSHGVELRTGESVRHYDETASAAVVTTSTGARVEGDLVVVAVGTAPNTEAFTGSGLELEDGVVVDEFCRTSVEGVYAAGDVARHYHPLFDRWMRVEHFDNASGQGMAAAKNILGQRSPHTAPHWFWSDQFGHNLQYAGHAAGWDELIVRGQVESLDFIAFYLAKGVVRAAFSVERGGDLAVARQLIAGRAAPSSDVLRDDDVDLTELL
jgi:3-phenylpropionate/trans-cinnamate dioxygenase ferredoxin reductase subunit